MVPTRSLGLVVGLLAANDCQPEPPTPPGTALEGYRFVATERLDLEDPTFEGPAEEVVVTRPMADAAVVEFRSSVRTLRYRFRGDVRRARIPETVRMTVVSSDQAVTGSCHGSLLGYAGAGGTLYVSCGVARKGAGGGIAPTHTVFPGDLVFLVEGRVEDSAPTISGDTPAR